MGKVALTYQLAQTSSFARKKQLCLWAFDFSSSLEKYLHVNDLSMFSSSKVSTESDEMDRELDSLISELKFLLFNSN